MTDRDRLIAFWIWGVLFGAGIVCGVVLGVFGKPLFLGPVGIGCVVASFGVAFLAGANNN